jgi:hypothetical protein
MTTWTTKWWALALSSMPIACVLEADQLEIGDEAGETDGDDANGDGDTTGDGDGDGIASLECVTQGTDIDGASEPGDYPVPECEIECATGFGHDVAALEVEWTLDLEHPPGSEAAGFTHIETLPDGRLLAVIANDDTVTRLVWLSPEGALLDELVQPEIDGAIWEVDVDADGVVYAIWQDGLAQTLTALTSDGEHTWTIEMGASMGARSVLAALDSGVLVAVNPAFDDEAAQLVRVDAQGSTQVVDTIPYTWEIDISPSGESLVLANSTALTWIHIDPEFIPTWSGVQGVADVSLVFGLTALDDQQAVSVGTSINWAESDTHRGYVKQIGSMGLEWEGYYDRALSWCPEQTATEEAFVDVAQLPDGSLIVTGYESNGLPLHMGDNQPWVGHVSAQGQVIATDRGFWRGGATTIAIGADGSAYVMLYEFDDAQQQHIYVRKYAP